MHLIPRGWCFLLEFNQNTSNYMICEVLIKVPSLHSNFLKKNNANGQVIIFILNVHIINYTYNASIIRLFLLLIDNFYCLIGLRFSPNGKSILLTTNGSLMRLLDAFNGHPLQTFAGHLNNKGIPVDGCFSPDSKVNIYL